MIQRVSIENKTIYFLEEKNKVALEAMLRMKRSRVICYTDLARMTRLFSINLSSEEKREYLGKKNRKTMPIIRKKEGGFMSSYMKSQRKLDDFIVENGFLRKNRFSNTKKMKVNSDGILLENGDPFVDFCIRKY